LTRTVQQSKIINYINLLSSKYKKEKISVNAFAGTGKSTLLKETVKDIDARYLGFAFNNSIVKENNQKFNKKRCMWKTTHVLAQNLIQMHFKNQNKSSSYFDFSIKRGDFKEKEILSFLKVEKEIKTIKNALNIYKIYCNSSLKKFDILEIKNAAKLQSYQDILSLTDSRLEECTSIAKMIWNAQRKKALPLTFDFYLKLAQVYDLSSTIKNIDFVLLDEAQDSNAVTLDIISKINSHKIFVGDKHQSIYGFRGTVNALDFADSSFYLSETFRYNKDIAQLANYVLGYFKLEKEKIKSNVNNKLDTRALIFRNNSAMISKMDELIKEGIPFLTIKKPDDIFACSISLLEKKLGKTISNDSYKYLDYEFKSYKEVEEYISETKDNELKSANVLLKTQNLDIFSTLKKAKEFRKSKKNIKLILTTAHTSKGLEFGHVELMKDFPDLIKLIKKYNFDSIDDLFYECKNNNPYAKEIEQEINLLYVAITRAISTLDFSGLKFDIYNQDI